MANSKKQPAAKKRKGVLASLDMKKRLAVKPYEKQLAALQEKLRQIQQAYIYTGDSAVLVFEGWDTAGKGGAISRISSAMDARTVKVWPIGPPRPYYRERHYLARFWERLPPRGAISIFDRSWYGRVLVERVEDFATAKEWRRAYHEINEFEKFLCDDGMRVIKIFLHITPEEQLRRFERRMRDPLKRWKLQYEDFQNRSRWDEYETAIEDMVAKTGTDHAPWHVVPGNNKKYARVAAIRFVCDSLSAGVDLAPRRPDDRILDAARELFDFDPDTVL